MKTRKNIITVAIDSPAAAGAGTQAKYISNKNDCIIVTSDSKDILQIAREMGVIDLHRPDSLSSDEVFTEPVMEHALEKYSPKNDDLIVLLAKREQLKEVESLFSVTSI